MLPVDEAGYIDPSHEKVGWSLAENSLGVDEFSEDESVYEEDDMKLQIQENLDTLKIIWSIVIIPFASRFIGRKVALWVWGKFRVPYNFPSAKFIKK
ncbi:hypothetical protein DSO57_1025166 [Entomophthora muscae]|uniref:Uncharacterized protein n=1 Tax=Entomophthora muscae TaxID=34485 RepID=A0ACC2T2P7_9FUNG|nr:hypothetical protein DSO57_1025166 [Entomophthora muscae]